MSHNAESIARLIANVPSSLSPAGHVALSMTSDEETRCPAKDDRSRNGRSKPHLAESGGELAIGGFYFTLSD